MASFPKHLLSHHWKSMHGLTPRVACVAATCAGTIRMDLAGCQSSHSNGQEGRRDRTVEDHDLEAPSLYEDWSNLETPHR